MEEAREEINELSVKIKNCQEEIKELDRIITEAEEEDNLEKAVEYLEKANKNSRTWSRALRTPLGPPGC